MAQFTGMARPPRACHWTRPVSPAPLHWCAPERDGVPNGRREEGGEGVGRSGMGKEIVTGLSQYPPARPSDLVVTIDVFCKARFTHIGVIAATARHGARCWPCLRCWTRWSGLLSPATVLTKSPSHIRIMVLPIFLAGHVPLQKESAQRESSAASPKGKRKIR